MAKNKKEKVLKVVEETKQQIQQDPGDENVAKVDETKFESAGNDSVVKVDLSKPPEPKKDEVKESNANDSGVVDGIEDAESTQEQEEVQPEAQAQETPVLEEITEEEVVEVEEQVEEAIAEAQATGKPLPENIQKLVDFIDETGGDINDYVKLNQDYSQLDDKTLLYEYYRKTKPHLDNEEITFLMEDSFSYDELEDEERDIKKKKIALKEQVANAKSHLDGQKSKYYEEIKSGSKLTTDQQKAVNFFDRYKKDEEVNNKESKKQRDLFMKQSDSVFNDKFKGFEYDVGDKKYRVNVNNAKDVKEAQSDISNFTKKFLDKKNNLLDAKGYHKSLYTAMNADSVAKHFYEQGKADAIKNSITKGKNVDMDPRQSHGTIEAGGVKVRVLGDNASDFKFKIKNKNK
tara:strand:+ start:3045 stop:4253 length:1209 start_codon:yes stop_codon:yes gene_type:complete